MRGCDEPSVAHGATVVALYKWRLVRRRPVIGDVRCVADERGILLAMRRSIPYAFAGSQLGLFA